MGHLSEKNYASDVADEKCFSHNAPISLSLLEKIHGHIIESRRRYRRR